MPRSSASFAWLSRPDGSVVMGCGPFTAAEHAPEDGAAFFVQDFSLGDPAPWKIPDRWELLDAAEFRRRHRNAVRPACTWEPPDAAPFSAVFQEVMAAIHAGHCEKTVPVVVERGSLAASAGVSLAAAMAGQVWPLMSYGWVGADEGFAGATPELLISLAAGKLRTMALAGTARQEDREVFAVDEKEIREHEYVARTLVSKLTDFGTLTCHPREILDLGGIVHFLTPIEVLPDGPWCPESLIRRLHPTPALGPLPRTPGTLAALDDWRRRLGCPAEFGAPFGVAQGGRFDAVVAIRGVWWSGCDLALPAGCGLIEASRLVNEWRELRLKREAVKRCLA